MKKFYGQFNPPVDQFIYEHFFIDDEKKNEGFFIECGAADGVSESSCKFFEESLGWRGMNIEASPPLYKRLIENRPNSINVNCALSDYIGKAEFTHAVHPTYGENFGNGSLKHTFAHKKELDEMGCEYVKYYVDVISYDKLISDNNIRKIDLFVLDVEGNELNVLKGMANSVVLPEVFCIEHGNIGKDVLIPIVQSLGYEFVIDSHVNSFFVKK